MGKSVTEEMEKLMKNDKFIFEQAYLGVYYGNVLFNSSVWHKQNNEVNSE